MITHERLLLTTVVLLLAFTLSQRGQARPAQAPCPRPPVLPVSATAQQWSTWQAQLDGWMTCIENGVIAAQNHTVSTAAGLSQAVRVQQEQATLLTQVNNRLKTVEVRPVGISEQRAWEVADIESKATLRGWLDCSKQGQAGCTELFLLIAQRINTYNCLRQVPAAVGQACPPNIPMPPGQPIP